MKRIILIILCSFLFLYADDVIHLVSFPWMTVSYLGEAKVFNTTFDNLDYNDPFYHAQGDTSDNIKVMEYVIDDKTGELYSIIFSMGESGDSRYEFYLEGEFLNPVFVVHTDHLEFLGKGKIIARGSMNEMFNRAQIFQKRRSTFKELKQAFYAININSVAQKDFDIYLKKNSSIITDHIQKGDEINVLLAEFKQNYNYYLVQSQRGISGWVKIENGIWIDESPIRDIYFHGD